MVYSADLHLHSPYAYACSKNLTLDNLAAWAKVKGIELLASADFTHPAWRRELESRLIPGKPGLYSFNGVNFVLGTEVSCVFKQGGRSRRVHLLLFAPDFQTVDELCRRFADDGSKLGSDGRPTLKMSARDLTEWALETNPGCMVIPAHVWTPWYGMFGSKSGFDSLDDCFLDLAPNIHAIETGLSSDPAMNWAIPELDGRSIVSFSDAHSLPNMGRELTLFEGELSYEGLAGALKNQEIAYTVEFYPEKGKYHYTGHRKCGVRQSPAETLEMGSRCPECGRPLTLGVAHRTRDLSPQLSREESILRTESLEVDAPPEEAINGFIRHREGRPPFIRLVPLAEVIAGTLGLGLSTKSVQKEYEKLTSELGSELNVLLEASSSDLNQVAGEVLAQAILSARIGRVEVEPGYDGEYGKIQVHRSDHC